MYEVNCRLLGAALQYRAFVGTIFKIINNHAEICNIRVLFNVI